jgi:V8-like Glu-specific endopeptidase
MITPDFSQNIDWNNFNSSLVIEVTRPSGVFTCTGVAIKKDLVLTAAHSLEGEILKIRVFNSSAYDPKSKSFGALGFEIHPDYNSKESNFKSDLAKIKLDSDLPKEINFFPIIKKNSLLSGNIFRLGFGARSQKNVRTLVTPVLKDVNQLTNTLELDDMYSYSGDSGGPIFLQREGQMYLVAIHSTLSYGPFGKFSYNPLLATHTTWINQ